MQAYLTFHDCIFCRLNLIIFLCQCVWTFLTTRQGVFELFRKFLLHYSKVSKNEWNSGLFNWISELNRTQINMPYSIQYPHWIVHIYSCSTRFHRYSICIWFSSTINYSRTPKKKRDSSRWVTKNLQRRFLFHVSCTLFPLYYNTLSNAC